MINNTEKQTLPLPIVNKVEEGGLYIDSKGMMVECVKYEEARCLKCHYGPNGTDTCGWGTKFDCGEITGHEGATLCFIEWDGDQTQEESTNTLNYQRNEQHQYIPLTVTGPIGGTTNSATEETANDCKSRYISKEDFVEKVAHYPLIDLGHIKELSAEIRELNVTYWTSCNKDGQPGEYTSLIVDQIEELYDENIDLINR